MIPVFLSTERMFCVVSPSVRGSGECSSDDEDASSGHSWSSWVPALPPARCATNRASSSAVLGLVTSDLHRLFSLTQLVFGALVFGFVGYVVLGVLTPHGEDPGVGELLGVTAAAAVLGEALK